MCRSLVFIILKFLLWMRFLSEFHRAFHCYRKYQVSSKLEMRGLEAFLAFYAVFTPEKQKGGLTPTHLAIVMEYGAGGELFERICNAGRFNEDEVVLTPTHLAIVMEYGAGGELFERICNAGRLSEDEVVLTPTHLAIVMEYGAGGELFERICNACRFSEDEVVLTPTHLAIVMEYGAGGELFERICNAGRFSEDEYVICFGNEDGLCFAKVKFNYEKLRGALECFSDFEKKTNLRVIESGVLKGGLNIDDIKRVGEFDARFISLYFADWKSETFAGLRFGLSKDSDENRKESSVSSIKKSPISIGKTRSGPSNQSGDGSIEEREI
ncbi:hypothetical protein ACS0TY_001199 [Phlomoides rotata]